MHSNSILDHQRYPVVEHVYTDLHEGCYEFPTEFDSRSLSRVREQITVKCNTSKFQGNDQECSSSIHVHISTRFSISEGIQTLQ